jgi:penicillin-binding protein 1A
MPEPHEPQAALPPQDGPKPKIDLSNPRVWMAGGLGAIALTMIATLVILWGLPLGKSLEPMTNPTLVLVSADGKAFARRGAYKDEPVDAAALPKHVSMAFVAIEDRRFFDHGAIDVRGLARAMATNIKRGETSQGGSTITQQLAKNAFTSGKRTLRRKVREAVIAIYLEARLSKNEILSRYLSSVYFGDGVFGLRGAAKHYFDKEPEALSIGEAALLAGLVKAPTKLAPTSNLKAAKARQAVVLAAMTETGVITARQARAARRVRLRDGRPELPVGSYFADWVSPVAKSAFDRAYGEVRVRTTLDSRLQAQAERILKRALDGRGKGLNATQGAIVAMRTDGRVVAMVGGRDYTQSQFNRAVQAERQPGSSFKTFVYLAALRQGATPDSLVLDAPIKVGGWSPQNYDGRYSGRMIPLRQAFARSSNVAAVRLSEQTGHDAVVRAARDLGLKGDMPDDATLALGTASVTLLDLTAAYAGLAAGVVPVQPYGVVAARPAPGVRRLSRLEHQGVLQLLRATVSGGTGGAAAVALPAYGKTGTTQDYRDAWFIGFAGDLVVGVWIGNDDNKPMKGVVGGALPAQIWREFMGYAIQRGDVGPPPFPESTPVSYASLVPLPEDAAPFMEDDGFGEAPGWFANQADDSEQAVPDRTPPPIPPRPLGAPEGFNNQGILPAPRGSGRSMTPSGTPPDDEEGSPAAG